MLRPFKLLIPVIVPSWRFFDTIAPSPRIEFSLLNNKQKPSHNWQEISPRPAHVSIGQMAKRLFWNPDWNDTLFLVSCAERLVDYPTHHSANEIFKRIEYFIKQNNLNTTDIHYIKFRLVFVNRANNIFEKNVMFTSSIKPYCHGDNE